MKIIRRAIRQSQKMDFKIHEFNVLLTTGWKRHGLLRFDERPG
jgi:hypothetical protein